MRASVLLLVILPTCSSISNDLGCGSEKPKKSRAKREAEAEEAEKEAEKLEPMSAAKACSKLADAGVGRACTTEKPGGLFAAAWEKEVLKIPEPAGKTCQVLSFRSRGDYDATIKVMDGSAALIGPHRYGNPDRLIILQCNEGMPRSAGEQAEKALRGL